MTICPILLEIGMGIGYYRITCWLLRKEMAFIFIETNLIYIYYNPIHSFYVGQQNSFVLDGLWKCVPNVYLKPIIKLKNKGLIYVIITPNDFQNIHT